MSWISLPILTFVMAVAYAPGLPSAANVGRWAVLSLGAAALISRTHIHVTKAHWMGAALLIWMALGTLWSLSPMDTLGELVQWTVVGVLFCVAAETEDLGDTFRALSFGVSVSTVFSILQVAGFTPVETLMAARSGVGLFLSKNMLVEVAAVALIGAIGLRFWWGVPGPIVCLILSEGREAVLMIVVAMSLTAWLITNSRGRALTVVSVSLAFGLWYLLRPDTYLFHISDRWEIWQFTMLHTPPIGWGLGTFGALNPGYEFSHNEFIQYAFELGAGVLLMIGVVVYAFMGSGILERAALAALVAAAMVWFPLHAPGPAFLGAVLAGHLCGVGHRARRIELASRMDVSHGRENSEPLWVGALSSADAGRRDLSIGSQHSPRSARVSPSLAGV